MTARKKRRAARKQPAQSGAAPDKPVSVYNEIISSISILEVVKRSIDPEAYELAALACVLRSLWNVHDRLEELGIGGGRRQGSCRINGFSYAAFLCLIFTVILASAGVSV